MSDEEDLDALRRSVAEPDAFRVVFERHHPALRRYLRARLPDAGAAEDLAAETFTRAFGARHRFADRGASVRAWLFAIATNLLRDELRSSGRRGELRERLQLERESTATPPHVADPQLREALQRLRREELEPLLLYAWAELTYEEIAVALDVSVGTVRSRLHRGRARLRDALDVTDHEGSPAR